MYLTPSNGAIWKSWPDFSFWNREELVDSRPDAESLRTRQPCYPARKMKVEERKFDQALTKMPRAKPEPHLVTCVKYIIALNLPLTSFKINRVEKPWSQIKSC